MLYYFTFTSPSPLSGILDFYLIRNFIKKVRHMILLGGAVRGRAGGPDCRPPFPPPLAVLPAPLSLRLRLLAGGWKQDQGGSVCWDRGSDRAWTGCI